MENLLVWWLTENECKAIVGTDGDFSELRRLPKYLKDEFKSRFGRPGRGRLWVSLYLASAEQDAAKIDPWPDTALARYLSQDAGGIVFRYGNLPMLAELPGIVTDLRLRRA